MADKTKFQVCASAQQALHKCKRDLGLLPGQCYPTGCKNACDAEEYAYKRCLAFAADARDAKLLYDTKAARRDRVEANQRLQKKLRPFNVPCTP